MNVALQDLLRLRIGHGYDSHRLDIVPDRLLLLGGIEIEYTHALVGHSDADVLLHAVIDSLLSAAQMPDIGQLYPDTDQQNLNSSSVAMLQQVASQIRQSGHMIISIDCTIIAQAPKISPYKQQIIRNIAKILEIGVDRVGLKAKTAEGMGALGRKEGIACHCMSLLYKGDKDE